MKKRLSAAFLALVMLLSVASCSKDNTDDKAQSETDQSENIEKATLLTGVFSEKNIQTPEEYDLCESQPYIDPETNNIKLVFQKYEYIEDEEGYYLSSGYKYKLCEYNSDFELISESDIELGEDYINSLAILADSILYMENHYGSSGVDEYYITKYSISDGSLTKSDNIAPLFDTYTNSDWFYIQSISADTNGNVYLAADSEVLVLNSDFVKQFSITVSSWIYGLSCDKNGNVYVSSYFDEGSGIASLNLETKSLSEPMYPGETSGKVFFADGYDFYVNTDYGINGCTVTDDGIVQTEIMNYSNSDIYSSSFDAIAILSPDTILANDRDPETYEQNIVILSKSDDIDLSNTRTIEIATADYTYYELSSAIVSYNKAHKDSRIVLNDYSRYNTDDDYDAGRTRLMNEVSTGLYKPDILIGSSYTGTASYFIENELFLDLSTLIDSDPEISSDDILDSVKRTFSTSDGKIWGLPATFSINTLVGKASELGGKISWTFEEMIDYASSLPEGVSLVQGETQSSMITSFDAAFDSFIDLENNTCNFETEAFYKYLNYLKTLPTEYNYEYDETETNYYADYQNGSIALYSAYIYSPVSIPELQCVFNTKDFTLIGMPVSGENSKGGQLSFSSSYMITNSCENPDLAWDFLKTIIVPDVEDRFYDGFSIFKSSLLALCEKYYDYEFEFYFSGGAMWGSYDKENPGTQEDMTEPGILTHFTEEDTELIMKYLNDECGSPLTSSIPEDVISIITEEITSFTGGAKSAEDCARVIQSRVSIYLAEHE